ncbi:hypothetical protein FA95DRAFT_255051 [Auriscalpium vulgare]|uniref:Uncharacterized protein n=1 Tax=Auriscalpium vulgare TaxID=40419 RepID=A0ACB8RKY5_9AGAM|nr:hypothetical protein FA95DRAFT_255051 [Auriscalpium vulgare]
MPSVAYLRRAYGILYRGLAGTVNVCCCRTGSRNNKEDDSPASLGSSEIKSNEAAVEVPLDLQMLIVEWVFRSSQHALIDRTTLRACALVCHAWTPTAQRLLFRRIYVYCADLQDRRDRIQLLVSSISNFPHLAAHVRYIQVAWPSHPPDYADVCVRLLELCSHVKGISFVESVDNNKALSAELDARMHAIQLRPMFLEVSRGLDNTVGRTIMSMCPGARVLKFNADYEYPLPPTVEALNIFAYSATASALLSNPLPALRHLYLVHPQWSDQALCERFIFAGILPQLQSLVIMGEMPPRSILELLTHLKTLVVGKHPLKYAALPSSLRHVGFHLWATARSRVRAIYAVVALRELPELQLVTVTPCVEPHVRDALEGMCREKRVDFATYESPECFQKPQDIDWI